jgi:hypothetical protein
MARYILGGVPRSGKSNLASRLNRLAGISRLPADSLVSTFWDVFPEHGISHFRRNHRAACRDFWPFLKRLLDHLEYEGMDFSLDVYHLLPLDAASLATAGYVVVYLGYVDVPVHEKLKEIRRHQRPGDWTAGLPDEDLVRLITRFKAESKDLRHACQEHGVRYYDTSEGVQSVVEGLANVLLGDGMQPDRSED